MSLPTKDELTTAIADAARQAFTELFEKHDEHFYYLSLISTGEALPPCIAAWSDEALQSIATDKHLKWSWADSPYLDFGRPYFEPVYELFHRRPEMNEGNWDEEYNLRYHAMEAAMARLDSEALFGDGDQRLKKVILVETVPPDQSNTERAKRLNPPQALTTWLEEASE